MESLPDTAEKIFSVSPGSRQNFRIVASFEGDFLQKNLDGILWLKSLLNKFFQPWGEAAGFAGRQTGLIVRARVLAKLARGQSIVGGFGAGVAQKGRQSRVPFAPGANPAVEGRVVYPDQGAVPGLFRWVRHERVGSVSILPREKKQRPRFLQMRQYGFLGNSHGWSLGLWLEWLMPDTKPFRLTESVKAAG
jgi:hypothetical protein